MPVKLFTGLPGAGKTACMVDEIVRLREAEPDRPIYARGIDGLAEGLAEPLPDDVLHAWWELPPGAILCIDECQEPGLMPLDRGQPAEWVKRISKVRHEGMDFLLTTQHPGMISTYVRRLVDQHVHAVRKFGSHVVARYTWGRCIDYPERRSAQKGAAVTVGTLPKRVFDLYKSASLHTMKRRLPKRLWLLVGIVVVLIALAVGIPLSLRHLNASARSATVVDAPAGAPAGRASRAAAPSPRDVDEAMRADDYAKWMRPRVAGLTWTAPAFDGQSVQSRPETYCIAVEDGRCSCISEQGTRVAMADTMCREIAANGVYNPFRPAADREYRERGAGSPGVQSPAGAPPANVDPLPSAPVQVAASGAYRRGPSIPQAYVPPEAMPPNQ